jgi:pimeloyl-ACP methyl ester carboxylesterase
MEEYFPDITVEIDKNAGHFAHYERPSLANDQILAFFYG